MRSIIQPLKLTGAPLLRKASDLELRVKDLKK